MERPKDDAKLIEELRAQRPRPRDEFAAELDERATAGFPRRGLLESVAAAPARVLARMRAVPPRRVVLGAGAASLTVLAVVAAFALIGDNRSSEQLSGGNLLSLSEGDRAGEAADELPGVAAPLYGRAISPADGGGTQNSAPVPEGSASAAGNRVVERWSKVFIGAPAADVPAVASEVLAVADGNDGIVMSSTVREGDEAGDNLADANFELLIPSGRVGEAVESFSSLGDVISRRDSTDDITDLTTKSKGRARESRARAEGLLAQLAEVTTDAGRKAIESELRQERRELTRLRARLDRLGKRARLSRVSVRIVGDGASSGARWGIGDALDVAGHALAVAAGVAIIGLAVIGPIALLVLLAWLARRAWLALSRRRALS